MPYACSKMSDSVSRERAFAGDPNPDPPSPDPTVLELEMFGFVPPAVLGPGPDSLRELGERSRRVVQGGIAQLSRRDGSVQWAN